MAPQQQNAAAATILFFLCCPNRYSDEEHRQGGGFMCHVAWPWAKDCTGMNGKNVFFFVLKLGQT